MNPIVVCIAVPLACLECDCRLGDALARVVKVAMFFYTVAENVSHKIRDLELGVSRRPFLLGHTTSRPARILTQRNANFSRGDNQRSPMRKGGAIMQIRNTSTSYGLMAQSLHWLTLVLVVTAWILGIAGDEAPKSLRSPALFVHVSLGVLLVLTLVARTLWRLADPAPEMLPNETGVWAARLAHWMHILLYALLLIVPVVGIILQFARGSSLPILGIFEIPSPWAMNRTFARSVKEVHEVLAHLLLLSAGLHALAALYHHWILKDRTLARMASWIRPSA